MRKTKDRYWRDRQKTERESQDLMKARQRERVTSVCVCVCQVFQDLWRGRESSEGIVGMS